jgi:hypothetical protein
VVVGHSKPLLGSMLASLPPAALITFAWIYYGTSAGTEEQTDRLATHSTGVLWSVLPSLPMFLVLPALRRRGLDFWPNLGICCVLTMMLYVAMSITLRRTGVAL